MKKYNLNFIDDIDLFKSIKDIIESESIRQIDKSNRKIVKMFHGKSL
jgi:hypothetical protein